MNEHDVLDESETFVFKTPDVLNAAELPEVVSHQCIYSVTTDGLLLTMALISQ